MKIQGRKSKRNGLIILGVFMAVFAFTFLVHRFVVMRAEAASLANFDPGYIISDYQMGNYNAMSEGEIQAFLSAKNPCGNRDYNYFVSLSRNPNYRWHFENGHFVCLSEERFGYNDNEIGFQYGETAAHIIWQAAQDYRINPQVIIVLLQKETGLITDPIPNNGDYRKATGYGCPDTAACSSQYYGFRNQVRNAASLFRTVLDGGWTNYPLGNNYIQYNPNAACGGSVVNIRSRATSALYRYTPYQPNAGALAAGYGTASCGAYGNRNFYLYFEDWFGGITGEGGVSLQDINDVYARYGGEGGILGRRVSSLAMNYYSGMGWVEFEHGYIVGNKDHGYHVSMGAIREKWASQRFEFGALGFPIGDISFNEATGIEWQEFEHGFIVGNREHGYYVSMGAIREKWKELKFEYGALGFPKSDIIDDDDGRYQEYDGGKILYIDSNEVEVELYDI